MNTLTVTPEMFNQNPRSAPNVMVAPSLVEQPEDVGFEFEEYYNMLRGVGVTTEDIASNTIYFSDEASNNLGEYAPDIRQTTIYVATCKQAAASVVQGEKQQKHRGYRPVVSDLGKLINEVAIHETGHFQHDMLYPKHTSNMRRLDRYMRRGIYIPIAEGLGLAAYGASLELTAPVVVGSFALLFGVDYYNPRERPAFRFETQQEGRKIVDFVHKAS